MLWLYVIIGIAVVLAGAAIFDRTGRGKRRVARGGDIPITEMRNDAVEQYRPDSNLPPPS
jgi:hypothetical protein